ncbi:MAG: hypothetical protein WC718_08435 [Phycisphaerales bacterium]
MAQVVIDGKIGPTDGYGAPLWVQNVPTGFGDNVAGGVGTPGNPADVSRGLEVAIPFANLGGITSANGLKITAMLVRDSDKSIGNQVIDNAPAAFAAARLGDPRLLNFQTVAGTQTLTLNPSVSTAAPTIDGILDTNGFWNGKRVWVESNPTQDGDNNNTGQAGNGSEIDNLYATTFNNTLYLFIGGNLHANNKIALFIDDTAGAGQNRLLFGNSSWSFGLLQRMSEATAGAGGGMTFENGFAPDRVFFFGSGNATLYTDHITIPTDPVAVAGAGTYLGSVANGSGISTPTGGSGANLANFADVRVALNNSNTAGVGASASGTAAPDRDVATGSELDSMYGKVENGELYLLLTGNMENNFNKLCLFLDVNGGTDGQNQLRGDNLNVSFNGLNRMGAGGNGTTGAGLGLKFDSDFFANYTIFYTNGNNPVEAYIDACVLKANGPTIISGFPFEYASTDGGVKTDHFPITFPATYADYQDFSLTQLQTNGGARAVTDWSNTQGPPNPGPQYTNLPPAFANLIVGALDNNNVLGVTGTDASGAASVTTGLEIKINLAEAGWDGSSPIKVAGFINSDGFSFVSNQVIGGLPADSQNLGEPSSVDFSAIPGVQYVVVPTSSGPACDPDVNQDGNSDQGDVDYLVNVVAGGPNDTGIDPDFNQDGNVDQGDIDALINVVAGGNCP